MFVRTNPFVTVFVVNFFAAVCNQVIQVTLTKKNSFCYSILQLLCVCKRGAAEIGVGIVDFAVDIFKHVFEEVHSSAPAV
jgi:hypothetical protein